ncbi:unnamed protein product [Prorocentrum cordatum]|uniref:HEAT repeat-containing protein 1 n=1 Tax=Prorocentrum cordatum TaxID=2364126 RepID=A0ABN9QGN9_9DINO|nr:unnamed protein product [Polarella glacialis]
MGLFQRGCRSATEAGDEGGAELAWRARVPRREDGGVGGLGGRNGSGGSAHAAPAAAAEAPQVGQELGREGCPAKSAAWRPVAQEAQGVLGAPGGQLSAGTYQEKDSMDKDLTVNCSQFEDEDKEKNYEGQDKALESGFNTQVLSMADDNNNEFVDGWALWHMGEQELMEESSKPGALGVKAHRDLFHKQHKVKKDRISEWRLANDVVVGVIKAFKGIPPFPKLFEDGDEEQEDFEPDAEDQGVRCMAAEALGQLGAAEAVPAFLTDFGDSSAKSSESVVERNVLEIGGLVHQIESLSEQELEDLVAGSRIAPQVFRDWVEGRSQAGIAEQGLLGSVSRRLRASSRNTFGCGES